MADVTWCLKFKFQIQMVSPPQIENAICTIIPKVRDSMAWGWRFSMDLAAFPAGIMMIGSLRLPKTLRSLITRVHQEKARAMLEKIRGMLDFQKEFDELGKGSELSRRPSLEGIPEVK